MAIEKMTFSSLQDVADAIDSLGWFDSVVTNFANTHAVECYIDGKKYLSAVVYMTGEGYGYAPGVSFWTKGKDQSGSKACELLANNFRHKYCMITKNGIIFASHTDATNENYSTWMLAKTNNGEIAVVLPNPSTGNVYSPAYRSAAIGETSSGIGSDGIRLCYPRYLTDGAWEDATQIIGTPIPTHPQSGTSIIKNGFGFTLCPRLTLGKWIINGTEYATNGIFALSDED